MKTRPYLGHVQVGIPIINQIHFNFIEPSKVVINESRNYVVGMLNRKDFMAKLYTPHEPLRNYSLIEIRNKLEKP